ncbi:MAG: winged helix-turn-helix transcriptional regulator [Clostridia bacterium]|nr:winged helix-turn-helix transcriptional regulator [Clostridia bacterium]
MNNNAIGKMLHRVENQIHRKLDSIAAAQGITVVQHIILSYLWERGKRRDVFQKELEQVFDVRRSSVSNVLGLLEKKNYIQRQSVSADARQKRICLTEAGTKAYLAVRKEMEAVEQALDGAFADKQERTLFLDMLQRLSARVQDI